ncbi:MAG: galactose mutarotase [Dysgonamonadaceae bacterium]|jgi:aldose 1-epimerase|nr:galactose mutarotase [Dysgonamonadaceae bacterium]
MKHIIGILLLCSILFVSCKKAGQKEETFVSDISLSGLDSLKFSGKTDGKENHLYVLKNAGGMEVCITNFGARIVSITVPDKEGNQQDVVLGFDNIDSYLHNKTDFGAAIGRYGNRIAKGKFTLDGTPYQLTINNEENSLHGGITGFQYQPFDIQSIDAQTAVCTYISPDGDNGYPGNLQVKVTYQLREDNALAIAYEATTDKPTVINLTNHSYFNLSGNPENTILDHILYLNADRFTPVDAALIPTGEIAEVVHTAFDFTTPTEIGARIDDDSQQMQFGMGYDHNWVFRDTNTEDSLACKLISPSTGISMEVYTTEPAVQFYTGNFLDGTLTGKKQVVYQKRTGLCLETQHYPDSPNYPEFPSTRLNPGEKYTSRTVYKFGIN